MALYEYTGTKSDTYVKGEKVRTIGGSIHDQRLAASKNFKPSDDAAPDGPADENAPPDPPAKNAKKEVWVDWAVDVYGWDRSDADQLTVDELHGLFGGGS